ncbi:hypothetical protein [Pararhizobium gei]|uniref:hypothetical protein n=1 Tax=Pararhizobium gei TaxID=1395951 RepID=UPI0023DCB8E8|nr:hypothetical protein [Rhizobium gei]
MKNTSAFSLIAIGLSSLVISGCVSEGGSYESRPPSVYRERVIIDRNDYRPDRRPGFVRDDDRDMRGGRDRDRSDDRGRGPDRDRGDDRDRNDGRDGVRGDRDRDGTRDGRPRCEGPRCPDRDDDNRPSRARF